MDKEEKERNISHGGFLIDFIQSPGYKNARFVLIEYIKEFFGFPETFIDKALELSPPVGSPASSLKSGEKALFSFFFKIKGEKVEFEKKEHVFLMAKEERKEKYEKKIKLYHEEIKKITGALRRKDASFSEDRFAEIHELALRYTRPLIPPEELNSHKGRIRLIFNNFLNGNLYLTPTFRSYLKAYEKITDKLVDVNSVVSISKRASAGR